ncbi:unnamed protein product, partial [Pylaiella littoralis]
MSFFNAPKPLAATFVSEATTKHRAVSLPLIACCVSVPTAHQAESVYAIDRGVREGSVGHSCSCRLGYVSRSSHYFSRSAARLSSRPAAVSTPLRVVESNRRTVTPKEKIGPWGLPCPCSGGTCVLPFFLGGRFS